jgi:hypothetical protein
MNDFNCVICCCLLDEPISMDCGHSFCRKCTFNWYIIYKQNTCPVCRQKLNNNRLPNVNVTLKSICNLIKQQQTTYVDMETVEQFTTLKIKNTHSKTDDKIRLNVFKPSSSKQIKHKKLSIFRIIDYFRFSTNENHSGRQTDFIQTTTCKLSALIYFVFLNILKGSINFLITLIIFIVS